MGGREREREIERDREIRYWFELDTGWGTDAVCIDDAWNRAQTWLGTCPRYEWWMIADVCIGKQSGNPVMEAEATVSGGMEKVKQGGKGRFFCQLGQFWTVRLLEGCWGEDYYFSFELRSNFFFLLDYFRALTNWV